MYDEAGKSQRNKIAPSSHSGLARWTAATAKVEHKCTEFCTTVHFRLALTSVSLGRKPHVSSKWRRWWAGQS